MGLTQEDLKCVSVIEESSDEEVGSNLQALFACAKELQAGNKWELNKDVLKTRRTLNIILLNSANSSNISISHRYWKDEAPWPESEEGISVSFIVFFSFLSALNLDAFEM